MIDGYQCNIMIQNRNKFLKRLVYQQISEDEIRFITLKVITVYYCKSDYSFNIFFTEFYWQAKLPALFHKKYGIFFTVLMAFDLVLTV